MLQIMIVPAILGKNWNFYQELNLQLQVIVPYLFCFFLQLFLYMMHEVPNKILFWKKRSELKTREQYRYYWKFRSYQFFFKMLPKNALRKIAEENVLKQNTDRNQPLLLQKKTTKKAPDMENALLECSEERRYLTEKLSLCNRRKQSP